MNRTRIPPSTKTKETGGLTTHSMGHWRTHSFFFISFISTLMPLNQVFAQSSTACPPIADSLTILTAFDAFGTCTYSASLPAVWPPSTGTVPGWSFGTVPLTGDWTEFTQFNTQVRSYVQDPNVPEADVHCLTYSAFSNDPNVCKNFGTADSKYRVLYPHSTFLHMHPGPDGAKTTVRFEPQKATNSTDHYLVHISGEFRNLNLEYGATTDVHVYINGVEKFYSIISRQSDPTAPSPVYFDIITRWDQTMYMAIDFVVGYGVDLDYGYDSTGLNATLQFSKDTGGFIVGDPQFVGLRGQTYQVHGVSGEVYNIISDYDLQYNSRFVFLDRGDCPEVNGIKQTKCFSHPGSYLGEVGIKTRFGDKIHIMAGDAKTGFMSVNLNGKALLINETVLLANDIGSISLNSTHLVSIIIGGWDLAFENSDFFVNQRIRSLNDLSHLRSHGLFGQSWSSKTYPNPIKYIQGAVDDYVIRDNDIFGDSFVITNSRIK